MIPTTNPPYPPFAKGGKQNHDTATDLPILTCTPLCKRGAGGDFQRGTSLVELIMFIVIVSVALAGILLVMNVTTRGSADPVIHKQALAIAESLLEEIELQDFSNPVGGYTGTDRSQFDDVMDYHGYSTLAGIVAPDATATPIPGLSNYNVTSTTVVPTNLGTASAVVITVTVQAPSGEMLQSVGYRTAY